MKMKFQNTIYAVSVDLIHKNTTNLKVKQEIAVNSKTSPFSLDKLNLIEIDEGECLSPKIQQKSKSYWDIDS